LGSQGFVNQGTISADTAAGTITLNGTNWSNQGTIEARNGGTLNAQSTNTNFAAGTLTDGIWQVFANSTLRLLNANISTNAATILLDGANSNFFSNSATTNALAGLATNASGGTFTIQNGRNFTTAGDFNNAGTLVVGANSTFTVPAANTYTQSGTLTVLANGTMNVLGNFANFSGGTLTGGTYLIGGTLQLANVAITTNAATIALDGSASRIIDQSSNDALLNLAANAGSFSLLNGRNFATAGDWSNSGSLTVASNSTLTVNGAFTQTAAGSLNVQLGGTAAGQFSQISVTGLATLDGTLNVTLVNGFTPAAGNTFQIMPFGSRSGDFATKTGFRLGSGLFIREDFTSGLTLQVFQAQLVFVQQPSDTTAGQPITPAVQVALVDPATGNPIAFDNNDTVTVAIGNNPGGGTLNGTLTVTVSGGIATFSDLSIDKAGSGYTLTASSAGVSDATSGGFAITPAAADHLLFLQQPSNTAAGQTISPAVMVAVVDQFGNVVTSDNSDTITLSIGVNPSGGTLSGTLTVTVVNGIATFGNLSINRAGTGYTLHAHVSGGLPDIDSNPFDITP
jgi:hypothetical protein